MCMQMKWSGGSGHKFQALPLAGEPPALRKFYHFNSCKRRATSSALARLLKALMRK